MTALTWGRFVVVVVMMNTVLQGSQPHLVLSFIVLGLGEFIKKLLGWFCIKLTTSWVSKQGYSDDLLGFVRP